MEPSDAVLARLDRIGALERSGAAPAELLAELRGLLREAEAWSREESRADGAERAASSEAAGELERNREEVVGRLRAALARDIIDG